MGLIAARLRLAAYAAAREILSAMRRRRHLRPLAQRVIAHRRGGAGGSAAAAGSVPAPPDSAERASVAEAALTALLSRRGELAPSRAAPIPGRIVLVCGSLNPGGAERQLVNTAIGLRQSGRSDLHLLCAHLGAGQEERYDFFLPALVAAGIGCRETVRRSPLWAAMPPGLLDIAAALPPALICDVVDLWYEFRRLRPEVVHAWLDWSSIRAGLAAALAGVPRIVLSGRNVNPSGFFFFEPVSREIYRALQAWPGLTMVNNSRAGALDYARWLGLPEAAIGVIYNGVAFPAPSRAESRQERARLGVAPGTLLVGSMFRFAPEKRPELWLDSAAEILSRRADAICVLCGEGPLEAAMRAQARALGIEGRVLFPGVTARPAAMLGAFDILLLTSEAEGTPNVAIEAQGVGTPIVACPAGGMEEAFSPGETGILVPSPDPAALADAVCLLAEDAAWRARIREGGADFVRARFGMERMIAETLAVYAGEASAPRF